MSHRRRTRVESRKSVSLTWGGGAATGELVNVSLKGCLVETLENTTPAVGEQVGLTIHLEPGAPEFEIRLQGCVVRKVGSATAVDFLEVPPEDFSHLFRLVQYNAADPDGIEEELGRSAFDPASEANE